MLEHEIGRRHLDAARVLARELEAPVPALSDKLHVLERELAAEAQRHSQAEELARHGDLMANRRSRSRVFVALALVWAAFGIGTGVMARAGLHVPDHVELAVVHAALGVVTFVLWLRGRSRGVARVESVMMEAASVMLVVAAGAWLVMGYAQVPVPLGLAIVQTFLGLAEWALFAFFDRRLLLGAVVVLAGAPATAFAGTWAFDVNGAAVSVAILLTALRFQRSP